MPERERERFSGGDEGESPRGRGGRFSVATAEPPAGLSNRSRKRFTVESLFADSRPQAVGVSDLPNAKEIQLDRIVPDPNQPRRTFDEEKLRELAGSITAEGVLQPIVVRYDLDGDAYVIVHGERRWRASRLAARATIPAIVREVPAERRLIHQLMENIVRDDLNAVDRAAALRTLKGQLGDPPWEQVAEAVGIRRSRLFQLLGTEKLPPAAREDIRAGRLSEKQSRALQSLSPARQEALRERILADDLGAGEATALARHLKQTSASEPEDIAAARATLARLITRNGASMGDGDAASVRPRERSRPREAELQPFDERRLHDEVTSLTRMLAAITPTALAIPSVRRELTALRNSLNTLLEEPNGGKRTLQKRR